jgi:PAS domain S-box-containing protein
VDFLLAERTTLFPNVPVIAAAITRGYAEKLEISPVRPFVTGTVVAEKTTELMDNTLRLRPQTKRVALVAGASANERYAEQGYRQGLALYKDKIETIDLTKLSMDETLSRVGSLPKDSVVFYSSIFKDGEGKAFSPPEALSRLAKASSVPVFGVLETYLGHGIVGGHLLSFTNHGKEAAAIALKVMAGQSPGSIPFGGEEAYVSAYDWRELKRWGISEKALPPGSMVEFKSLSVWEEHKGKILGGLFFIGMETLLIIALFVNLHKRRQAEAEIASSALRYRTVADYTYDWEYWSAPDGSLNYVSPSCERITGYSVKEFTDDPSLFLEMILPEDRKTWDGHDHEGRGRSKPGEIQFRIRTKGGEIRWIEHNCLPVKDVQGDFLGVRASNRDITDRKRAEFEAQQQRNELAHVTRVAAMGELTSSLAHELNQPLAAIRNYANAAQRFLSLGEPNLAKAREALEGIVRDDKRAAEVISGIRGLLKKEEPRFRPVHINEVVQELLVFIRGDSVLEGLSIETELAREIPAVPGDTVQLKQVLLNLMLNALDAMNKAKPDSRRLVIKTEKDENGEVKVSVRDFGAGIDENHLKKLFEPFHTTKPGGMGMGLAISERIINAHGGSIRGENKPDGGALFCFTLPAVPENERLHEA